MFFNRKRMEIVMLGIGVSVVGVVAVQYVQCSAELIELARVVISSIVLEFSDMTLH